jgi:hypothetical protein
MPCARSTSRAAGLRVVRGDHRVGISRSRSADAQSAIQSFQTCGTPPRVPCPRSRRAPAESAVEHRDVDALGVHHAQALPRIDTAAMQVVGIAERVTEIFVAVLASVA